MNSKVAVVGTVGLPACYGGFESLVENLVRYNKSNTEYTVFCSGKYYKNKVDKYLGANLLYVPMNANGISSIGYDIRCLIICLRQKFDAILILGVSGCIFLPIFKIFSNAKIITNIDGLEWRRDKWGRLAKWFLKLSEKIAIKYSDIIISDNEAIGEYVLKKYGVKSEVIAYGGDHAINAIENKTHKMANDFYLSLCRIEPENNVHIILDVFSKTQKKLKFIGNWSRNEYGLNLKKKYSDYSNIELLDPIYDLDILYSYRSQCVAYIHGHSAGGTNPSLVEAMHFGKNIIAFDCDFNRYTTENSAIYFSDTDTLSLILSSMDNLSNGSYMKGLALRKYTWETISSQYHKLFNFDN